MAEKHTGRIIKLGDDIDTESEKKLIESNYGKPVVVTNFPSEMKPFYMKECGDSTVGGFDILFPIVGEMVGGSQREEDYETLKSKICFSIICWYENINGTNISVVTNIIEIA